MAPGEVIPVAMEAPSANANESSLRSYPVRIYVHDVAVEIAKYNALAMESSHAHGFLAHYCLRPDSQ